MAGARATRSRGSGYGRIIRRPMEDGIGHRGGTQEGFLFHPLQTLAVKDAAIDAIAARSSDV